MVAYIILSLVGWLAYYAILGSVEWRSMLAGLVLITLTGLAQALRDNA